MNKVLGNTTVSTFAGHVIHCIDQDGMDEFNVEVLISTDVSEDKLEAACFRAAEKSEMVEIHGNTFAFEYLRPSGRKIRRTTTIVREELSERTEEAEKLLQDVKFG